MEHMNMALPRFAAASAQSGETWNEADTFDVEMLAEFLLDDATGGAAGITFDFNMDNSKKDSTMVSPENSEDGNLPTVADGMGYGLAPPQRLATQVPLAPAPTQTTTFPTLPASITNISSLGPDAQALLFNHQQATANGNIAKRRRFDSPGENPMIAVAGGNGTSMINGQQLAAAAAQAMQQQGRGRKKSQAQIDRRRERNRILARRTRLRKKFFFEGLQKDVLDLQRENQMLKDIVKTSIGGEESAKILAECDAESKMPEGVLEACNENGTDMDQQDFSLVTSIQRSQHSFLITDPSLQDNPIVFASDDFLKLTGYAREQVLGRNCRFLQGTATSQDKIDMVRKALSAGEDVSVTMINYTATGKAFWNKLFIAALRDAQNNIVNFIGVVVKVASPEQGDAEFGKLLPGQKDDDELDDEDDME